MDWNHKWYTVECDSNDYKRQIVKIPALFFSTTNICCPLISMGNWFFVNVEVCHKLQTNYQFFFWPRLFQSKAHKSWTPTTINKCELRPEPSRISFVEEKALKQNKKKSCDTNTTVVYHHRCCRCFSKCTPTAEFKDYQMERKNE